MSGPIVCPRCQAESALGSKFCPSCGLSFVGDSAPQRQYVEHRPTSVARSTGNAAGSAFGNLLGCLIFVVVLIVILAVLGSSGKPS